MTFNIPIWAIALIVLFPFFATLFISLGIGLFKEFLKRRKAKKEKKEEESKRLDDLK